jgi:hypothetical protein
MPAVALIRLAIFMIKMPTLMVKMLIWPFVVLAKSLGIASARRQQADRIGRAVARHAQQVQVAVHLPVRQVGPIDLPPPPPPRP